MVYSSSDMDANMNADGNVAPPPEIAVSNIWVNPTIVHQNEAITMGAECMNVGGSPTGEFTAKYTLDGGETHEISMPNLNPGQTYAEEWKHEGVGAGNHTFDVCFDSNNVVNESNKDNNCSYFGFDVLDYDA